MGLDMFLTAKRHLSRYPDNNPDILISDKISKEFSELAGRYSISTVEVDLGYWRKANAIHKWFVENLQDGKDECQESFVLIEELLPLLDLVRRVLADPSQGPELLPTESGFFFGSTEYDEYYLQSLRDTEDILQHLMDVDLGQWNIFYRASW